jgi:hypothetical protein
MASPKASHRRDSALTLTIDEKKENMAALADSDDVRNQGNDDAAATISQPRSMHSSKYGTDAGEA